jgi:hypothetical protein
MALVACRECSKEVSTEAASCPHCGAKPTPAPTQKKRSRWRLFGYAVLGLIALNVVVSALSSRGTSAPRVSAPAVPVPQPAGPAAAAKLRVTVKSGALSHGYFKVSGTIENVGTAAAFSPSVTIEVYDGKTLVGKDTAYATGHFLKNMAPGSSASFESMTRIAGGDSASSLRWSLNVDKYEAEIRGMK